jgi:hypothetical protein
MTATAYLVWFVFMAVATATILVVCTLGAAGLLHRPRRRNRPDEPSDGRDLERQPGDARASRHPRSEADAERSAELVDALMPLGSSLSFVSHLSDQNAVDARRDPEDPQHGRAA